MHIDADIRMPLRFEELSNEFMGYRHPYGRRKIYDFVRYHGKCAVAKEEIAWYRMDCRLYIREGSDTLRTSKFICQVQERRCYS